MAGEKIVKMTEATLARLQTAVTRAMRPIRGDGYIDVVEQAGTISLSLNQSVNKLAGGGVAVDFGCVPVRNFRETDIEAGAPVVITQHNYSTGELLKFRTRRTLRAGSYSVDIEEPVVGVAIAKIKAGGTGQVCLSGVVATQVRMNSPTDRYASFDPNEPEVFQSGETGDIRIIEALSDSGICWAYVRLGGGGPSAGAGTFLAEIHAIALQSGHAARWNYTFREVEFTATTGTYQAKTGGRTGTAINLRELSHTTEPGAATPWYVWGVQSHSSVFGSTYPAGAAPRPVGGGGTAGTLKTNFVVNITERTTTEGDTVYTFEAVGSHDGTCS